jgi:nicotinic acid mononucleotide adenylyltransferase
MRKILFYPITGNPPHLGHASAVLVALDHLAFDEVWIMPSGKRMDKVVPISDKDRMNLSSLFVEYLQSQTTVPIIHKSIGVDGTDDRFMHEHIIELKSEPNAEIFQLVGIDGFMSIKDRVIGPDERFVVIKRSGYEIPEGLVSNKNLIFLDEGVGGISSTKVREMVRNSDLSYKELVPKEVGEYIEKQNLYKADKDSVILSVSKSLKQIYDSYPSQGILAVYIWGSLLTLDFNPESSDVDTIAIVEDDFDFSEEEAQKQLALLHPEIKKLGFRFIYKSELDTGLTKGALGSIGNPALLLLDLPTWYWVCGTHFTQKDFALPVPSFAEAIKLRYENTKERWPDLNLVKPEQLQYLVKQILRIVHLIHLERKKLPYTLFSYSSIKETSRGTPEADIVDICLEIKASGWNFNLFKSHIETFKNFISDLSER